MLTIIEPTSRESRTTECHPDGTFTISTGACRIRSTVNWSLHIDILQVDASGIVFWKECLSDVLASDEERDIPEELHAALDCYETVGGV